MSKISIRIMRGVRTCAYCGVKTLPQKNISQNRYKEVMLEKHICYECAFWMDLIANPPESLEIIGNVCYKIFPMADGSDKTLILGGGGKVRYFMRENLYVFRSNDIWTIGLIPERFRGQLPDSAVEITKNAYVSLSKNKRKCRARACFDRYSCIRFDMSLEEKSGAFNVIPKKWKTGDEHCGFFLNKKHILKNKKYINSKFEKS